MTTTDPTRWRDKQLLFVPCPHGTGTGTCDCNRQALAELHARWCADTPDLAAQRQARVCVSLAGLVPVSAPRPAARPEVPPGAAEEPPDPDLRSALAAWVGVALAVLVLAVLAGRQVWLWVS